MKKFYVYVHVCPNGKRYVGCTAHKPEYRWGRNGEGYKGQLFGKAVRKYGWSSITHEVFEVESEEEMYRKEVELISFYHSNDPEYGYNCSSGGEKSASGCRRSEEIRKHMSEAAKKRASDPEFRKHMSEVHKGKPAWNKGKPRSEEAKRRISEANKGQIRSEESRQRIAENNRRKAKDPEFRRKISEAKKGKPQPRVKISLPDGTIIEISKQNLVKNYVNKGRKFEYVS